MTLQSVASGSLYQNQTPFPGWPDCPLPQEGLILPACGHRRYPIYLTAILEYLATERDCLVIGSRVDSVGYDKNWIIPRRILLVMRNDELWKLIPGTTIAHGGVPLNFNLVQLLKKMAKKASRPPIAGSPKKA